MAGSASRAPQYPQKRIPSGLTNPQVEQAVGDEFNIVIGSRREENRISRRNYTMLDTGCSFQKRTGMVKEYFL
jgi:hypothetical protein